MIVLKLSGGLGNQMFQYAAGLSLADRLNVDLRLDLTDYENKEREHERFDLQRAFGISGKLAEERDYVSTLGILSLKWSRQRLNTNNWAWIRPKNYILEPHLHFWPGFYELKGNIYLEGYWQSERYFERIKEKVRSKFTFNNNLDDTNRKMLNSINEVESVAIHVRRGDYYSVEQNRAVHGVDLSKYYISAVRELRRVIDKPHFFLFSDEPDWVHRNFNISEPFTIVGHNVGYESYRDMQLMSTCKHQIIANSSFSWWGAWLNSSPRKIVIAPKHWLNGHEPSPVDIYFTGSVIL